MTLDNKHIKAFIGIMNHIAVRLFRNTRGWVAPLCRELFQTICSQTLSSYHRVDLYHIATPCIETFKQKKNGRWLHPLSQITQPRPHTSVQVWQNDGIHSKES